MYTLFLFHYLAPYIENFKAAAEERGLSFPFTHLKAHLVEGFSVDATQYVCGIGWSNHLGIEEPRIEIKKDCWNNLTNDQREVLMLHELGHAILDRDHIDSRLFNNSGAKSIMCSRSCRNQYTYYEDWPLKEYYIDELFDPRTSPPNFIKKNNFLKTVFEEDFEHGIDGWKSYVSGTNGNTTPVNYLPLLDSLNSEDASKSLALYSQKGNPEGEIMIVSKEFDFSDFNACSNLKASANIDLSALRTGFFEMHLRLTTKDDFGFLETYYLDLTRFDTEDEKSNSNKVINMNLELFCITERLETVVILFHFFSRAEAKVYIKDVKVDLIE